MSFYKYNNGQTEIVTIDAEHKHTKLYVTVTLKLSDDSTLVAGHSIVNLAGKAAIKDVQFEDHPLDYGDELHNKSLSLIVDVSKFKMKKKKVESVATTVTCTVAIEAGSTLIDTYELDDKVNTKPNSVFEYLFTFKKG